MYEKTDMKNSRFKHIFNHTGLAVVTAVVFGGVGTYFLTSSFALSTNNPSGYADFCQLEGANTVIYGWAYDPQAPAGVQPYVVVNVGGGATTVASSVAGYRDAPINDWIVGTYGSDAPRPGTYGWRLQLSNLYKGTTYAISGTVQNYGAGANTPLGLNTANAQLDGGPTRNIFAGNKIPDACLTTKPAPAPTPTPTPTPTPAPTPKPVTPKPVAPAAPAAPTVSSAADATVTAGTTTASLSVPTGNAGTLYVRYGTKAENLDRSSAIQTVSGPTATVNLEKLTGKTTYTYQIVRTLGDKTTNSPNATFTTKSYTITMAFTNASGKPVSGISAQLGSAKAIKSDKDGKVTFSDLSSGSYSVVFSYNGQSYAEEFTTSSAAGETGNGGAVLAKTIDLSKIQKTGTATAAPAEQSKSSSGLAIVMVVLLLAVVGVALWVVLRRKRRLLAEPYGYGADTGYLPPVLPQPVVSSQPDPQAVVGAVAHHSKHKKTQEPAPTPVHMGESLRDMVIQSMAADEAKHPHDSSKRPIVPGSK